MITDWDGFFAFNQTALPFDGSSPAIINGTPIHGYISSLAQVQGMDFLIELQIAQTVLLVFILYYLMRISRRTK